VDRELLIEIGCEEIPASWLPGLTSQLGKQLDARLKDFRLDTDAPAETYSTPRRLTARVVKLAERQTDFEELVTGPPVSAAFRPDGEPTPAAAGFAKKHGVEVAALERTNTPKGSYLAHTVRQRGKATVDVLPDVMAGLLRSMTFPKQMRWDAYLEDGKGDLVFARPIRWLMLLYGGRVVPFVIRRTELAQGPTVQDIRTGANTYGHRFLTTSGRAGRAIKVKTFDDYEARLLENFVILQRSERESKIKRELETHARKLGGRVSPAASLRAGGAIADPSSLLQEVPDLVEYPSVVAGHYPVEFLQLPEEVLTTTMIHHQHYFPVVDDDGKLKPAFLAVTNTQAEKPEVIARNSERVLMARLRDARFFWDEDRQQPLESRIDRLATILFHKTLGDYKQKALRVSRLAGFIANAIGRPDAEPQAAEAGLLSKADLATDMVREFTELQGTMGGIYAREEGKAEAIWKAIYFHYLPIGVEADAAPSRQQLGAAAVTWSAVSLADKFDSLVGMFAAGERPTGSRDPLGLRRQAQGAVKILADLPQLTGVSTRIPVRTLLDNSAQHGGFTLDDAARGALFTFVRERVTYLFQERGFDVRNVRAVLHAWPDVDVVEARLKLEALAQLSGSTELHGVATLFKRVKNITKDVAPVADVLRQRLTEPAEVALVEALPRLESALSAAASSREYRRAFADIGALQPLVAKFFDDVLVMAEDADVRDARLSLVGRLRDRILDIADISEIVTE
jgi:glycyl-tRNA synthetase beta chain